MRDQVWIHLRRVYHQVVDLCRLVFLNNEVLDKALKFLEFHHERQLLLDLGILRLNCSPHCHLPWSGQASLQFLILNLILTGLTDKFDHMRDVTVLILRDHEIQNSDLQNLRLNLNHLESKLFVDTSEVKQMIENFDWSLFKLEGELS